MNAYQWAAIPATEKEKQKTTLEFPSAIFIPFCQVGYNNKYNDIELAELVFTMAHSYARLKLLYIFYILYILKTLKYKSIK